MRKGFTFIGLLLVVATLSDSWTLDGVDRPSVIPGCPAASVLKHEIVVARSRSRSAAGVTVRLPRSRPAARLPHPAPAVGLPTEAVGSVEGRPTAVDPAFWLGRRHLKSPS